MGKVLAVVVCACVLPLIAFVLMALWPYRVQVAWGAVGLVVVVVIVLLVLRVMGAVTENSVRLHEESLRPGRLYSHERLVSEEMLSGGGMMGWSRGSQQGMIQGMTMGPDEMPMAGYPFESAGGYSGKVVEGEDY